MVGMAAGPGAALLAACVLPGVQAKQQMDCGEGVSLCGVLALESGFGPKKYLHSDPVVHGLWPQVPPHGNSECWAPKSSTTTSKKHRCYASAGKDQLWFQNHEWENHGTCAGTADQADFLEQVCSLSQEALDYMNSRRDDVRGACKRQTSEPEQETCFLEVIKQMKSKFPVYSVDQYNDQIMLSACAGADGVWKLAKVEDFPRRCGSGAHSSSPAGTAPGGTGGTCKPGHAGPGCTSDSDCWSISGCARCAKSSKKCTDQPAPGGTCQPGHAGPSCASDGDCSSHAGCVRCAKSSKKCTDKTLRVLRDGGAGEELLSHAAVPPASGPSGATVAGLAALGSAPLAAALWACGRQRRGAAEGRSVPEE